MRNWTMLFAILITTISLGLSSCKKEQTVVDPPPIAQSSYTFTFQGITSTEYDGEIQVCKDGFFLINGTDPSGGVLSISTSEILVGETRDFCSIELNTADLEACLKSSTSVGFSVFALQGIYSPISGTATRTSDRSITVSGIVRDITTLGDFPFTLEATAGLYVPINCK